MRTARRPPKRYRRCSLTWESCSDARMKSLGRWSLAVAVLAISGWVWLRIPPEHAPAASSKPSATPQWRPIGSADDRNTRDPRNDAARALANGQANKQANEQDWMAQFHAVGSSYFKFVTVAARAAYEGD